MIAGAKDKTQELKFQARKMKEDNEKKAEDAKKNQKSPKGDCYALEGRTRRK
jgi:hypothetical protein